MISEKKGLILNKKFITLISFIALIFVLSIALTLNKVTTGHAVVGQPCTERAQACSGEDVLVCINGVWENIGPIPGPDGCSDDTTGDETPYPPSEPSDSNLFMWVVITILVILIIAVIGLIIYFLSKRKDSFVAKNLKTPPKKPILPPKKPLPFMMPKTPLNSPIKTKTSPTKKSTTKPTPKKTTPKKPTPKKSSSKPSVKKTTTTTKTTTKTTLQPNVRRFTPPPGR